MNNTTAPTMVIAKTIIAAFGRVPCCIDSKTRVIERTHPPAARNKAAVLGLNLRVR